jgi:hypothetical protein
MGIFKKKPVMILSAFKGSPGYRQRPDWLVIGCIGALLVLMVLAGVFGLGQNAGQATKVAPTAKPSVPAKVSPAATISALNANKDIISGSTKAPVHTGVEARAKVIDFYTGYAEGTSTYSNGTAARHDYFIKFIDTASIAMINDQTWYDHVLCINGALPKEVIFGSAVVVGNKATVLLNYGMDFNITPSMVVDLTSLKIVSIKCVTLSVAADAAK